ncbi:TIGR03084 family metal-binding protein [Lipingzhangella sp. LS1_29]|uniref:TIGR03084 family metal-binding protein n=1 Tax=Lipingzhangella rawalii TaxID=2055835 RepID=A0ABU2H5E6_9ACTN|nr:TIGR03084 family metal-binding protein [Lipingzhangella rawalii]MDS1270518.1 TIGR03084 family metal-binding protein [Lipingzhangella rawalii]
MTDIRDILHDLRAEGASLDALVAELEAEAWRGATPADGWTIAHQIAHLAWTDEVSLLALTEPDRFPELVAQALDRAEKGTSLVDEAAEEGTAEAPHQLLQRWRSDRERLLETLGNTDPHTRVPWFGTSMRATSMATARIMETWAHGQDVADALGVTRSPTSRLRHVAHLGVRTRDFAYAAHGLQPPPDPFRIELRAPDNTLWTWGPEDAEQRVTADALDFCLLVTQRRHRNDLTLTATGPDAQHWLTIAQAFAGPPGAGRAPEVTT